MDGRFRSLFTARKKIPKSTVHNLSTNVRPLVMDGRFRPSNNQSKIDKIPKVDVEARRPFVFSYSAVASIWNVLLSLILQSE